MTTLEIVLLCVVGLFATAVAYLGVHLLNMRTQGRDFKFKHQESEKKLAEARAQAETMVKKALKEAKEVALKEGRDVENLHREKTLEIKKIEERMHKREESINSKLKTIEQKENELKLKDELLAKEMQKAKEQSVKIDLALEDSKRKLQEVANLSIEEARDQLKKSLESDARKAAAAELRSIEEETRKTGDERAKSIIATAIQRIANEFVADATVSVITLPSDDMKGRIIGREGRNIRAIEQATGVDIIIDDTPEAVIISCFNPVRREIAKTAIERLIADGRIHPARIEEIVQKTRAEFEQTIREAGERSSFDCGVTGLHVNILNALGKLKYMSTGGQSVLQHSVETSQIAGHIATELGLDMRLAKRAALLHDIGKSLEEEVEGNHWVIGSQFLQKHGEPPEVVEAALKHHDERLHGASLITVIVQTANILSNFRPGARKEFVERAIERLREIENSVENYEGIEQAFVIRSGREVRAMVQPSVCDDEAVTILAKSVAKKLRQELNQQGHVKVTMVREQRATYLAK